MSYYATVFPEYWTGPTGRAIQQQGGKDATLLGLYLFTNRHANMIGLYRLEPAAIIHETPLNRAAVVKSLEVLASVDFADYDAASEHVWVREMARFRLGLTADRALQPGDNRVDAVRRLYAAIDDNPFLEVFFQRYGKTLHLKGKRTSDKHHKIKPLISPSIAPPKPVNRIRYRDQDQVQRSGSGTGTGKSTVADAPAHTHPVENSQNLDGEATYEPVARAGDVPARVRHSHGTDSREPDARRRGVEGADQGSADRSGLHVPGIDGRDRAGHASSRTSADPRVGPATVAGDPESANPNGTPGATRSALEEEPDTLTGVELAPDDPADPAAFRHLKHAIGRVS